MSITPYLEQDIEVNSYNIMTKHLVHAFAICITLQSHVFVKSVVSCIICLPYCEIPQIFDKTQYNLNNIKKPDNLEMLKIKFNYISLGMFNNMSSFILCLNNTFNVIVHLLKVRILLS